MCVIIVRRVICMCMYVSYVYYLPTAVFHRHRLLPRQVPSPISMSLSSPLEYSSPGRPSAVSSIVGDSKKRSRCCSAHHAASKISTSPTKRFKRLRVPNFTRGRSLMSETGIWSQWATLEANSGAIFPILRSSRIPQLLGDPANLTG